MPSTDIQGIDGDLPFYDNVSQKSLLTTRGTNQRSDEVFKRTGIFHWEFDSYKNNNL